MADENEEAGSVSKRAQAPASVREQRTNSVKETRGDKTEGRSERSVKKKKAPRASKTGGQPNTEPMSVPVKGTEDGGVPPESKSKADSKEEVKDPKKDPKQVSKGAPAPAAANPNAKKNKVAAREKMKEGDVVKSEAHPWRVKMLLGSGGFGDVYKVVKDKGDDKREFAMKTEMVEGNRQMLRLKIEVTVLKQCHEVTDPEGKRHFVEFVDRGITEKFKFLVMGLVGPSLEDIRKQYLWRNFCKSSAMQAGIQTLRSLHDLHNLGWLHRDIKPQNFAVGLGEKENIVYMLDFGISRKIFKGDTREVKVPRVKVKFLGTLRFAARACHHGRDQGRKDDLETWLYMVYDLLDMENGLPWKKMTDRGGVILAKEKFFIHMFSKPYKIVPKEFKKLLDYIDQLKYADEPDHVYLNESLVSIAKENNIKLDQKLEWIGKLKKKREKPNKPAERFSASETSSDMRQSGSEDSVSEKRVRKPRASKAAKQQPKAVSRMDKK